MRKIVLLSAALVLSPIGDSPAHAQERGARGAAQGELTGEVSASQVVASDTADLESEDGNGGSSTVLRGSLDYDFDFGATDASVSYDAAAYFYQESGRSDRWSNRVTGRVGTEFSDAVQVVVQVAYASNTGTVEASSTDHLETLARVELTPDRTNRIRLFGGYSWRDYDADGSEGRGPVFGAEYRYRLRSRQYLTADIRREDIQSDSLRRGYDRTSAALFYQAPLAEHLRLSTGLTARWWEFDNRLAGNGERLIRRTYTPEVELQYATRPGVLLRGRLQHILRSSNDPDFARDFSRAVLTAGYRF